LLNKARFRRQTLAIKFEKHSIHQFYRYVPSTQEWVRNQVDLYERTNGREGGTLSDTGLPVIILWTLGAKSGKLRKTPLMRVEHDGEYALVASKGGAPDHPFWYYNLIAHPDQVTIHDRDLVMDAVVRQVEGQELVVWWERAVAAFPPYAEYQTKTERRIPVFVASALK
jgi:deazaflavin-dependent oxidoreductase (nitroreductase family)